MTLRNSIRVALAGLVLVPGAALAHPGHEAGAGLAHGFIHPLTGLDHILAMLLVGLFAYQLGGRALWLLPATFVAVMGLGGAVALSGAGLSMVEIGIAASVILLGAAVALNAKAPVAVAAGVVGLFAMFHGFAHGAEIPAGAGAISYGLGFMAASALLTGAGIGLGFAIANAGRKDGLGIVRSIGSLAAVAGVGLLVGIV